MRARPHLVKIAERRFERDYGAGAVALSPDHPTLVQWRRFQRNCVCTVVTDANREKMLRQMHAATDTLGRVLSADKSAYAQKLFARVRHADQNAMHEADRTQDTFTLDTSQPVTLCVHTTQLAAAP
jgi:hypothetical protein